MDHTNLWSQAEKTSGLGFSDLAGSFPAEYLPDVQDIFCVIL